MNNKKIVVNIVPEVNKQLDNNDDRKICFPNVNLDSHKPELEEACRDWERDAADTIDQSIMSQRCKDCGNRFIDSISVNLNEGIASTFEKIFEDTADVREYDRNGQGCKHTPLPYIEHDGIERGVTMKIDIRNFAVLQQSGDVFIDTYDALFENADDKLIKDSIKRVIDSITQMGDMVLTEPMNDGKSLKITVLRSTTDVHKTLKGVLDEVVALEELVYGKLPEVVREKVELILQVNELG